MSKNMRLRQFISEYVDEEHDLDFHTHFNHKNVFIIDNRGKNVIKVPFEAITRLADYIGIYYRSQDSKQK